MMIAFLDKINLFQQLKTWSQVVQHLYFSREGSYAIAFDGEFNNETKHQTVFYVLNAT